MASVYKFKKQNINYNTNYPSLLNNDISVNTPVICYDKIIKKLMDEDSIILDLKLDKDDNFKPLLTINDIFKNKVHNSRLALNYNFEKISYDIY